MKKLFSKIAALSVGLALAIGFGVAAGQSNEHKEVDQVHASDGDSHSISSFTGKDVGVSLNNGATPNNISVSNPGYSIKQVIIGWNHNKDNSGVTASVTVGGTALGSGTVGGEKTTKTTTIGDGTKSLTGDVLISFSNSMSGTGKGTLYLQSLTLVEGTGSTPTPTPEPEPEGDTITLEATGTDQFVSPWSVGTAPNGYEANRGWQWSGGKSALITYSSTDTFTQIDVTTATNGGGVLSVSVGGIQYQNDVEIETGKTEYNFTGSSAGNVVISLANQISNKSVYIKKIVLHKGSSKTLSNIVLSGDLTTTEYTEGDAPSAAGLVVTANYEDADPEIVTSGAVITPNPAKLTTVGNSVPVSFTATYGGKTSNTLNKTVKVNEIPTTPLSDFFDGSITLKTSRDSLTDEDWFYISGTVVAINGYQYYIQQGEYGILIFNENSYHYTYYNDIALGDVVKLHTRIYSYSGLIETNSRDEGQTVKKVGTASLPEPIEYSTVATFKAGRQSVRSSLSNTMIDQTNLDKIAAFTGDATGDQKFDVYDKNSSSDTVVVLIHKSIPATDKAAIVAKLKTITLTDTVEYVRTVSARYNGVNQISLSSADQIIIHSSEEDKLEAWGVNYLFMNDSSFDGDGSGLCKSAGYYEDAKRELLELETDEEGTIAKLRSESKYENELARYEWWARACGDDKPYENDFSFKVKSFVPFSVGEAQNLGYILVISISGLTILAIGILLVTKRKHR